MRKALLATTIALALTTTVATSAPAQQHDSVPSYPQPVAEQWRSYWVDAFNEGIDEPGQVKKLVSEAKKANANVLVVQTARRFDCFCNDALYPRTDAAIAPRPFDPLAAVIDEAHAHGLQVHAWINTTTLWNSPTAPTSPEHVYNAHGLTASGADRWLNKRVDGTEQIGNNTYIDPANPAAVDYIVDAVTSIQRNYRIDGINLDYIRYPDHQLAGGTFRNDWGYSEVSLARFRAETGRSDTPDPSDEQFSQWRRAQVSNLVRKIYVSMWAQDPADRLSINGITYANGPSQADDWSRSRPYTEVLQDWSGWVDEGIVDTVTAMNYKRAWVPEQAQMFQEWTRYLAHVQEESGRTMVDGPALYLNEVEQSLAQARAVTDQGLGWSGYSYANPTKTATAATDSGVKDAERDKLASALTSSVFSAPSTVPTMPWKDHTGVVSGHLTLRDGSVADQVSIRVKGIKGSREMREVLTDGSGWFGVVNLEPGTYLVQIHEAGVSGPTRKVVVRPGEATMVDTWARRR